MHAAAACLSDRCMHAVRPSAAACLSDQCMHAVRPAAAACLSDPCVCMLLAVIDGFAMLALQVRGRERAHQVIREHPSVTPCNSMPLRST